MSSALKTSPPRLRDSVSIKLGTWFEAHATGWGVAVVPIIVLLVGMIAALRYLWALP